MSNPELGHEDTLFTGVMLGQTCHILHGLSVSVSGFPLFFFTTEAIFTAKPNSLIQSFSYSNQGPTAVSIVRY